MPSDRTPAAPRSPTIARRAPSQRLKEAVNGVLSRSTGYHLTRVRPSAKPSAKAPATSPAAAPRAGKRRDRLVEQPAFLLSSVRSGSTLLRVILDTHSQICAPHELHLRVLKVKIQAGFGVLSMKHLGLDEEGLEHLLWDRLLERELTASGKRIIVDKTPNNVFMWERLPKAWPKARFIFLLRHPAAIADSLYRATKEPVQEQVVARVLEYATALEAARQGLTGLTVRYEDLVADPERVTAEICEFLGVPWERSMLDYGAVEHGPFVNRLGDWSDKIRSGEIHSDITLPTVDETPPELRDIARAWGYLD